MKTLYIECNMGAAGDMLASALLELIPDREGFLKKLNGLGIPGVEYRAEKAEKCGIAATHLSVTVNGTDEEEFHHHHHHDHEHEHADHEHHDHEQEHEHTGHEHHGHEHGHGGHHHSSMDEIRHILDHMDVDDDTRRDVLQVYDLIAEAESLAHDKPVTEIHFHEVGAMDAIADITAVCLLLRELAPEQIVVSPVATGSGQVRCAHGILPVPAPATAHILEGVPNYAGDVESELCTPTGAALIKCFADDFGPRPVMTVDKTGYGAGSRDFEEGANLIRVFLGEADDVEGGDGDINTESDARGAFWKDDSDGSDPARNHDLIDEIIELKCNLDDMTGEQIGYVVDQLLFNGAADAFLTPIYMKKNRPATLLTCLCREDQREEMVELIFRYTSTIGIRETVSRRYILDRSEWIMHTDDGPVRTKRSRGYGVDRKKYEYDDLARLARDKHISIQEAKEYVDKRGSY